MVVKRVPKSPPCAVRLPQILGSRTSFQYTAGISDSIISWESFADRSCRVFVNDTKCNVCSSLSECADGFFGVTIDCRNVLNIQDGPTNYQSCAPEEGGVLDVFGWMDKMSWVGCPLVPLAFVF